MIPALLGLTGKLKTLTDRLTAPRAALIDNADATVTSRAPAATALSNATWTDALATALAGTAKLDRAEVLILTGNTGAGTGSKTVDTTVASVTTGKAVAFFAGGFIAGSTQISAQVYFTTTTNLRVEYVDGTGSVSYEFAVVLVAFA